MAKGATVFRNTGCDGKTDLCFKYQGKVYEIDVKLAQYQLNGNGSWSWKSGKASYVKLPVYPLIVVPATGTDLSGWYCRWKQNVGGDRSVRTNHCPSGLENFWD